MKLSEHVSYFKVHTPKVPFRQRAVLGQLIVCMKTSKIRHEGKRSEGFKEKNTVKVGTLPSLYFPSSTSIPYRKPLPILIVSKLK